MYYDRRGWTRITPDKTFQTKSPGQKPRRTKTNLPCKDKCMLAYPSPCPFFQNTLLIDLIITTSLKSKAKSTESSFIYTSLPTIEIKAVIAHIGLLYLI